MQNSPLPFEGNLVLIFGFIHITELFHQRGCSIKVIVATLFFSTREKIPNNVSHARPDMVTCHFVGTRDKLRGVTDSSHKIDIYGGVICARRTWKWGREVSREPDTRGWYISTEKFGFPIYDIVLQKAIEHPGNLVPVLSSSSRQGGCRESSFSSDMMTLERTR